MAQTTLAVRLQDTFLKFKESINLCISDIENRAIRSASIREVWKRTFGCGDLVKNRDIDRKIFSIGDELDLLREQISYSDKITNIQKKPFLRKVDNFYQFIDCERLNLAAVNNIGHNHNVVLQTNIEITDDMCGELGFIGHALIGDFPETALPVESLDPLIAELDAVLHMLDEGSFDLGITLRIKRKINAVIWCLQHPGIGSLQDAYEELGGAILNACQADRLSPTEEGREQAGQIVGRLSFVAKTIGGWVSVAGTALEIGHHIKKMLPLS